MVGTAAGDHGLLRQKTLMLQPRPEISGFRCRIEFVASLKMARTIVIYIAVSDALSVAPGHIRRGGHQYFLRLSVVVIIGRHAAFDYVVPYNHAPHRIHTVVMRA